LLDDETKIRQYSSLDG